METRANFIIVGLFALLAMAGILGTVLLLSKTPDSERAEEYVIFFTESVSGLSIGNPVRFSGIQVGQVKDITISRTEPGAVRVRIAIRKGTPVRKDSKARLEMLGLTGASSVTISGGTAYSPLVVLGEGEVGTIESVSSPLAAVMEEAPNTLALINESLSNLEALTGEKNQDEVKIILSSLAEVTSALAKEKGSIKGILQESQQVVHNLNSITKSAEKSVLKLETIMDGLGDDTGKTITTVLPELRVLIYEARLFVQQMTRTVQKIENDPRQFLFGAPIKEYTLK